MLSTTTKLTVRKFNELSQRALVAPITPTPPIRYPWFVDLGDGRSAAVHHLRSVALDRLLSRPDRVDPSVILSLQRAVRQIIAV